MPRPLIVRLASLARALAACLLAAATLGAQTGVWENVTPAGINLSPNYPSTANGYGVQDVLADPIHPGTFYAFVCYQGCWKSTDWGTSWVQVDTDNKLEGGRPWGEAIAPDGSYMLACNGYNTAGDGGAWKSTNGGVTWTSYAIPDPDGYNDPYNFDIDKSNAQHALASMHGSAIIWESQDGGQTWANRGSPAGSSPYIFFLTSTTWLAVPGWDDTTRTMRTTDSGTTWTAVSPTALYNGNLPMEHFHGNEQIAIDPSGIIYVPSETGIYRSTDGGASFTQVNGNGTSSVFATATTLYAEYAWALNSSPVTPNPLTSPLTNGTSWTAMPTPPAAMTNGAKRAAVAYNAATANYVIVSGNWTAGIWRYTEPSTSATPPTVVNPAAAAPATVSGTTTALSALGNDAGGAATLTYSWSTTGSPPAAVAFSPNASNAAQATTATFAAAGSYALQVTITDANDLTVTSSVTVTVTQTLAALTITPAHATVAPSATEGFSASARDQFGAAMAAQPAFSWSVAGGGTISTSGLFTAASSPGGPYSVNASGGGLHGTAQVTVAPSAPSISAVSPTSGGAGTIITITGSNLGGTTAVTIGGVSVPFTVNPAGTQITLTVPAGTPGGPVVVTTAGGSATSATPFSGAAAPASADSSSSPHRCGHGGISVLVLLLSCAAWRSAGGRPQRPIPQRPISQRPIKASR